MLLPNRYYKKVMITIFTTNVLYYFFPYSPRGPPIRIGGGGEEPLQAILFLPDYLKDANNLL